MNTNSNCPICTYSGRIDNVKRHMSRHTKDMYKLMPIEKIEYLVKYKLPVFNVDNYIVCLICGKSCFDSEKIKKYKLEYNGTHKKCIESFDKVKHMYENKNKVNTIESTRTPPLNKIIDSSEAQKESNSQLLEAQERIKQFESKLLESQKRNKQLESQLQNNKEDDDEKDEDDEEEKICEKYACDKTREKYCDLEEKYKTIDEDNTNVLNAIDNLIYKLKSLDKAKDIIEEEKLNVYFDHFDTFLQKYNISNP